MVLLTLWSLFLAWLEDGILSAQVKISLDLWIEHESLGTSGGGHYRSVTGFESTAPVSEQQGMNAFGVYAYRS